MKARALYRECPMSKERQGDIYQHVKSEGLYELLYEGRLERDMTNVVVYRYLLDGRVWVRPTHEFYDPNRFRRVT